LYKDYDLLEKLCHMSDTLNSCSPFLPFPFSFSPEKGKVVPLPMRAVRGRQRCTSNFDNFTIIYKFYDARSANKHKHPKCQKASVTLYDIFD
jgi:hypothetical protein